jgi:aspartate/methionine/tyrosine aminotransferase
VGEPDFPTPDHIVAAAQRAPPIPGPILLAPGGSARAAPGGGAEDPP